MEPKKTNQADITRKGNPRKPQGRREPRCLAHERQPRSRDPVGLGPPGPCPRRPRAGHRLRRRSHPGPPVRPAPGGPFDGVDYSDVSVALSRQTNAADVASGKLEVLEASVEALPFGADTFHKIVTVESFYFWPNPLENLKEVRRVLRPGGGLPAGGRYLPEGGPVSGDLGKHRPVSASQPHPGGVCGHVPPGGICREQDSHQRGHKLDLCGRD